METKINKKFRFLPLLPYGICSRSALYLGTKVPEITLVPYSPDMPMEERERLMNQAATSITRQVERMMKTGYIEEKVKKYGAGKDDTIRMISLTKAGFFLLTSTPDDDVEDSRIDQMGDMTYSQIQGATYWSTSEYDKELRELQCLRQTDKNLTAEEIDSIDSAFYDALDSGEMTILACASAKAKKVNVPGNRFNGKRIYRSWRLSNINALFMANNFLTYLDRRPIDTGWAISTIRDKASYKRYIKGGQQDVPSFMYYALNKWYSENPGSYRFLEPIPGSDPTSSANQEEYEVWNATPAFYAANEIPGFSPLLEEDEDTSLTQGLKNNLRHTFAGIAVGKKNIYIVHHTRPTNTPWGERWEMTTIEVVQKALEEAEIFAPNGEPFRIQEALIVCGSVYQFEAFFTAAKSKISKKWSKEKRVGVPYNSVCLIPINGSGAMQLRYLMNYSPVEMDYIIARTIEKKSSKFNRTNDPLFPLSYDGIPVLLAHSMQLQKLYDALVAYSNGQQFYVSCYPGQTKYIRRIMPDIKFL